MEERQKQEREQQERQQQVPPGETVPGETAAGTARRDSTRRESSRRDRSSYRTVVEEKNKTTKWTCRITSVCYWWTLGATQYNQSILQVLLGANQYNPFLLWDTVITVPVLGQQR